MALHSGRKIQALLPQRSAWNIGREINIGVTTQRGSGPIFGNIGKVPLNPDIELVTGMAMIGKRIIGWEVD